MQGRAVQAIKKILTILLICMLSMSNILVIAENSVLLIMSGNQIQEEQNLLEISQTLITSKEYRKGEETKKILQTVLEIKADKLEESSLKSNRVTLTSPIEGAEPEEIYISELQKNNFVNATWEYNNGNIVINLENDELEKIKEEKVDKLIITYVYADTVDVSKILTKASAEGELYSGEKVTSEETSYEIENEENFGEIVQINIHRNGIYKTELQKENQEFEEITQVNLGYKNTEIFNKITLSDIEANLKTKYKSTLINKQELLNAIGENGTLTIKNGEDEICKIDKETETNEEGNIVINYEEEILEITIEITLGEKTEGTGKVENGIFNIISTKEMEKINEDITTQIKTIDVVLEKDKEIARFEIEFSGEIQDKITKVEFGLNKQILTVAQENELTATITIHSEDKKYDLSKNPRYQIVLPKEVEIAELGQISILNNKNFSILEKQVTENENGQKVIAIMLSGEQTEYVEEAGSVQIIVPLQVSVQKLIPTTNTYVELLYINENAESYNTGLNYGREEAVINIISDADLIVATEGKIGETEAISYKTDISKIELEKTEDMQTVEIKGTVINNTETAKENLYIIGENELLSEVIVSKGNVYYSESSDGPWGDTISEGQKYFKIEIDKLEIGEKLEFTYNMQIPEILEESKNYNAIYKVYDEGNLSKESKLEVEVKVEKPVEELKVEYKSRIEKYGGYEIENVEIDSEMMHEIFITNSSNTEKNAVITLNIPGCINKNDINATIHEKTEEIHPESGELIYSYIETAEATESEEGYEYNIKIPANKEIIIYFEFQVEKYVEKEVKTDINILIEGQEYNFEDTKIALSQSDIKTDIKAYANEKEVKTNDEITLEKGDKLKYITTITNNGETTENIEITNYNQTGFKRIKQEIYVNDVLVSEEGEAETNAFITEKMELKANDEIKVILTLELLEDIKEDRIIENYSEIKGYMETVQTEKISLKLLKKVVQQPVEPDKPQQPEVPQQPNQPDEPQQPEVPEKPAEPEAKTYSISGLAWLDKNKDGKQDENEDYLKGIEVTLLNSETSKKVATSITDSEGKYEFKNLNNGKYVVTFGYNTATYNLTAYKKSVVEETKNSDAILATQNGTNIAKTEVIEIKDNNITNIDIGLILKEIFDLEVTKQIKKITVKNNAGQTEYEYNGTEFAKIEIPSKYFKGTNLVIEYEVKIENKGDIAGSVKTLTDNKPEGLKFASELNTSWYEGSDGKLYCIEFGADEIMPGEVRTVSLVLTKQIDNTETQYITNEVELEDVFNEYLISEKDTENNKAEATLIVTIKTGGAKTYLGLWIICAVIIVAGTQTIKKKII